MSFTGSRPYLKDAVVAKNYLSEKELRSLELIVSGYLDFAERQAERGKDAASEAGGYRHGTAEDREGPLPTLLGLRGTCPSVDFGSKDT